MHTCVAVLHEIEVELFRNRPELARELLRLCAGLDVGDGVAELGSADITQVLSAEFRADAVTIIRNDRREPSCAIVVEVQRSKDEDKRLSWPVYIAGLRAKLACPVILLVVVPDDTVATWARRPIDLGHPGFSLRPLVVAPRDVPRITEVEGVAPELVMLSAIAHPHLEMARAVATILEAVSDETKRLYLTFVLAAWPQWLKQALEAMMRPELEAQMKELMYKVGHESGLEQGRQEGRVEGLQRGAIEIARARGVAAPDVEQRILAITNPDLLTTLCAALGRAANVDDARAALAVV